MFGGTMISLILPKLIRSVARDGIFGFLCMERLSPRRNFYLTTQGKPAAFNGQLAKPATECSTRIKLSNCPASFAG
jgi:hypothetical protein